MQEDETNSASMASEKEADTGKSNAQDTVAEQGAKASGEENRGLTQEQVNEIVRDRLAKSREASLRKYGVGSEEELASLLEKGRAYGGKETELATAMEDLALLRNGVSESRRDDVRIWFKGKGTALTDEALKEALASHPEWAAAPSSPKTSPVQIGAETGKSAKSEEDIAKELFGLKNFVK